LNFTPLILLPAISGAVTLGHNGHAALWVDRVVAFSTGIQISIFIQLVELLPEGRSLSPLFPWAVVPRSPLPGGLHLPQPETGAAYLRLGIEFSNGASAATGTWDNVDPLINGQSKEGPIILHSGGGGSGSRQCDAQLWIWPFPPPGSLTVHAAWPGLGMDEVSTSFSGDDIAAAKAKVITLWPDPGDE